MSCGKIGPKLLLPDKPLAANEGTQLKDTDNRKQSNRHTYTGVRCRTPMVLEC